MQLRMSVHHAIYAMNIIYGGQLMKRLSLIAGFVCLSLLAVGGLTSACGGFFCTNTPVDQSAERIIFTINDDETISAIVGIDYEGAAEDFSWVVPVPTPPELDVAPTSALDVLQNATNPRINPPANYCRGVLWSNGGLGGGGGGGFLEEGNLGPYDYAIIGSDNPRELIEWLRDNGYIVTEAMEPIITQYVIEGMYFLAMKLSNDAQVGDIQPVKMTYKSTNPMIPLRLTAVAALEDMPVLVWVFGDTPYSPENWVDAEVDFGSFRTDSQLRTPWEFNDALGDYLQARNDIQEKYDGRAFITEYAMPSVNLLEINQSVADESTLVDLINDYPFVTRLRAQLSPDQMTIDPVLIPDTRKNHVPQTIELGDYVDPLHYWGCSTREFDTSRTEDMLPNSVILPGNVPFRYPAGWVQSSVTYRDVQFTAFAPQPVTAKDLDAFFVDGELNSLMMLSVVNIPPNEYFTNYSLTNQLLGFEDYRLPENVSMNILQFDHLFTNVDTAEGVIVYLSTRDANRAIYNAVAEHLQSYTYYAHPQLRNTLALAELEADPLGQSIMVGFPEGWTEFYQPSEIDLWEVVISPDDGGSARVELLRSSAFWGVVEGDANGLAELQETYGLSDDTIASMRAFNQRNCHQTGIAEFELDGQRGYLRAIHGWLVVAYSVSGEFDQYNNTLRQVAESVTNGYGCLRG